MRSPSRHLGRLAAFTALALALVALSIAPAQAAAPPKVGLVSFTNAALSGSQASLTISWPAASGATKYEIALATTFDGVLDAPVRATTSSTQATLGGLKPGTDYFLRVRGTNADGAGPWSTRVGHPTISEQGPATGPTYSVMTYNMCSAVAACISEGGSWATRAPNALKSITSQSPDVLLLQESAGLTKSNPDAIPGYTRLAYYSSKTLLVRSNLFDVVTIPGGKPASDPTGLFTSCVAAADRRVGCIDMGGKYAVWAEVEDRTNGARTFLVDAHLSAGNNATGAKARKAETERLVAAIAKLNPGQLPVVIGGDFNSNKSRDPSPGDTPARVLNANGFTDAYDLAESLTRQHQNSYNDWNPTPKISYTWGDHVDHVWVQADRSRVVSWANAGLMTGTKYTTPMPSDHNPVLVKVQLSGGQSARPAERLAGADRYATAVAISKRAFAGGARTVYVADGRGFADGLAGGPRASRDDGPLLLVPGHQGLPSAVANEIKRLGATKIVVLGGTASVNPGITSDLEKIAPVTRVSGEDRYGTAAATSSSWSSSDVVYLASGRAFPDALSASALAASQDAPLLLTGVTVTPAVTTAALDRLKPTRIVIVGGTAAVSVSVEKALQQRPGVTVSRVAGGDRYKTSVAALKASGSLAGRTLMVANGLNFPDALAGTPAAHALGAGFALVARSCVPAQLDDLIRTSEPSAYIVLGGTTVVGQQALTSRCAG